MLTTGPLDRPRHLLLAHGAGAPMTSVFLDDIARLIDSRGITVHRFEFAYMAARRTGGSRTPPPRAELLRPAFAAAVAACRALIPQQAHLVIGGKSMGGRIAAMMAGQTADPPDANYEFSGVAVFGYPFHPPSKPSTLRLAPLADARVPVLIIQGTRDPLGGRDDVSRYSLRKTVRVIWIEDGDHDLNPRRTSGQTHASALAQAADAVAAFFDRLETAVA